jgi:hypothetical protein
VCSSDLHTLVITPAGLKAIGVAAASVTIESEAPNPPPATVAFHARPGTKQALIISRLSRQDGATLAELIAATGWLPHTTRAALTGLRHKGFVLDRAQDEDKVTTYRIVPVPSQPDSGALKGSPEPQAA